MKIVVIGPIYPFRGGISHSNTMLCQNLSKNHEVIAISFKRLYPKLLFPGKNQRYSEKRKFNIKVHHIIDSINPFNWINIFLKIKNIKPDLIILQWWTLFLAPSSFTLLYLLKMFTKIKMCVMCQNVFQHEKIFLDSFLIKLVFKQADYFVTMSSSDLKDIKKIIPKAKVNVLVEPTYDQFFASNKLSKNRAKKQLGLKGNVILFFGFVRPYKGLKYLLDAMPTILKNIDLTLLIVGEFWGNKKSYLNQINSSNISKHVEIIDKYIPDEKVPLYFSAVDTLILPYTSATQSAILQTAFGFNKPVITTQVGSLVDLVDNNKTGILVPPKNSKELANAIIDFYKNKKENKFINNIKKSKKIFEWNKEKEKILFHGL